MSATTDQILRNIIQDFGTLTITARMTGGTYIARAAGVKRRSTTCTSGPRHAAERLACKIYGVAACHLSIEPIGGSTVYSVRVIDPEGLGAEEALALWSLIEAGGMGDITSPVLATTLRNLDMRRPGLVTLAPVEADSAGVKPYFGAVITAAGRAAYDAHIATKGDRK